MADNEMQNLGDLNAEMYFPTHIFFRDFPDAATFNTDLKASVRAWRTEDDKGIVRSNAKRAGSWHSTTDMHERDEFAELARRITLTANEIFDHCGYDPASEAILDNMWANVNPPGGYNRSHIHPSSLWSGVYYIQAPENAGQIVFVDPRTAHLMLHPRFDPSKPRTAGHWTEVFYEPTEGRLILFPSWLYHEVEANTSQVDGPEGERISVSFNFYQRRKATGSESNSEQ